MPRYVTLYHSMNRPLPLLPKGLDSQAPLPWHQPHVPYETAERIDTDLHSCCMRLPVIVDGTHSAPIGLLPGFRFVSGGIAIDGTILVFDDGVECEEPSRLSRLQHNHLITERGSFIELNVLGLPKMHGTNGYRVKI